MKLRSKFLIGAAICVVAPALFFSANGAKKRHELERTRTELKDAGFKIEISELETNHLPEAIARGKTVLKIDIAADLALQTDIRVPVYFAAGTFQMQTSNSVVVAWKEEFYSGARKRSPWPAVHQTLEKRRSALDAAITALLEGPVVFDKPEETDEGRPIDVDQLPASSRAIAVDALCHLYYGQRAEAWTNLVALTRLVTRSEMRPRDELRSRLALVPVAFSTTWQVLQAGDWSDQQLSALEAEWSQIDFFKRLPNSIAYTRASVGIEFEELRHPKADEHGITLKDLMNSPRMIPSMVKESAWLTWYRSGHSYDDERNALLYLRDREVDLRRAIQASTVVEMLKLPSVTNAPALNSKHLNSFPASIRVDFDFFETLPGGRAFVGSLAYAAEAEIRRRILLTVISLERFKLRDGAYPEKLDVLTNAPPKSLIDFADGQPLRYRRTDDGHFLLYSIGLDCFDDGGDGYGRGAATNGIARLVRPLRAGIQRNTDVLWPLPTHFPRPKSQPPEQ